jgi:hypothetical protein
VPEAVRLTPLRHRLSTRIILLSFASLMVVPGMISGTLYLSWKLEEPVQPSTTPGACGCARTGSPLN